MNVIGGFVLWGIISTLFLRWAKQQERDDAAARRERSHRLLAAASTATPGEVAGTADVAPAPDRPPAGAT